MTSIFVVLLTVVLEYYTRGPLQVADTWRASPWGRRYFQWGEAAWPRRIRWAPETVLWLVPGIIVLAVLFILHIPVLQLPLEVAILFFCLHPPLHTEPTTIRGPYLGDLSGRMLWSAFVYRYAVFFWFAILGIFGALTYYLCTQRAISSTGSGVCAKIHPWLLWLPAQITGFLFALVGSFNDGWRAWNRRHVVGESATFIRDTGVAAMRGQSDDMAHGVATLVLRGGVAWIVLVLLWLGVWS